MDDMIILGNPTVEELKERYEELKYVSYVLYNSSDENIIKILNARGFDHEHHGFYKKNRPLIGWVLAIDFDGTIVKHDFPNIGELMPDAKEVINRLHDEGYYICIWSCRGSFALIDAYNWLKDNEIAFDKFNEGPAIEEVNFSSHPKIYANYYIDDSNLGGLPSWKEIYKILTKKEFK